MSEYLDLAACNAAQLDAAVGHYARDGFLLLAGLDDLTERFRTVLGDTIGADARQLASILDPGACQPFDFPLEVRQRLARIATSPDLAAAVLARLGPFFQRLLGPLVHVSGTYHSQFKGGPALDGPARAAPVDHGGYPADAEFREMHGPYMLHQDFTGANIPTSPSGLTLWLGMNACPNWTLRLYPGSHRLGMISHRWFDLDDRRLAPLGAPRDVAAQPGRAILFNALLLHGTSNAGPRRRVSCDIRFFPLCGFLPSQPIFLADDPLGALDAALPAADDPVLAAPLWESLVFLGRDVRLERVPRWSALHWVNYIAALARGDTEAALADLERFLNRDTSDDPLSVYAAKFHARPFEREMLRELRARLAERAPGARQFAPLDHLLARLDRSTPAAAATGNPPP